MNHLTEEQIVLHYYGDADGEQLLQQHLSECSHCREEFARVRTLLEQIPPLEVPEPFAGFENKTWLQLRDRLPSRGFSLRRFFLAPPKWALVSIIALIVIGAFVAGLFWPRHDVSVAQKIVAPNPQRVVLVAVDGHLQRSQMLLVEIMHADAKAPGDLSTEQQTARELLDDNYLYRASAQRVGDPQVAAVLDDLGRVLAEIANSPSDLSSGDLREIHQQINSQDLLFKVRVVGAEVNSRVRQERNSTGTVNQRL